MLTVKNIRSDERDQKMRVLRFLEENPDPGVRTRPGQEIDRAIDTGFALLVERDNQVRACSLVYDFVGKKTLFSEIGTMRVIDNGLGLQAFLTHLHLAQIALSEHSGQQSVFAVVARSTASEHVLRTHGGLVDWAPVAELMDLRERAGLPFDENKITLIAQEHCTTIAFSGLRSCHMAGNQFKSPKGGETITLSLGWFSPQLLNLYR